MSADHHGILQAEVDALKRLQAKPADVKEILETLVILGRARKAKDGEGIRRE